MRLQLLIILSLFTALSHANSYNINDCNILNLGEYYKLDTNEGYCLETKKTKAVFVNLSSVNIESINVNQSSSLVYPNEYLTTTGMFSVSNAQGIIIGMEQDDLIVARDLGDSVVTSKVAPVIVYAAGGGVIGVMAVLGNNPDASFQEIAVGAFSGMLSGGLVPIMGAGVFGTVAAGAIGISATGACSSCHM